MITLKHLQQLKQHGEKFSCITAYDATFARLISAQAVETLLVGDSLGNVIQGHANTIPVDIDAMCYHVSCVARGNSNSLLLADLPFMSYASTELALGNAARLMQAGAHVVKLEGGQWLSATVKSLTERGIPVCAHLGLTPQSVHALSGFGVQGRDESSAQQLLEDAKSLAHAGAQLLVLECVPANLAADVSAMLTIPVIGIGAGSATDGQVLVMHDLLGLDSGYLPKFVKNFMAESKDGSIAGAIQAFHQAVKAGTFPNQAQSFS